MNDASSKPKKEKIFLYVPFLGFDINHHAKDQGGLAESFASLGYNTYLIIGGRCGTFNLPGYQVVETGNIDKGKSIRGNLRELFFVMPLFIKSNYNFILMWNYNRLIPLMAVILNLQSRFSKKKKKIFLRLDWDGVLVGGSLYKFFYICSLRLNFLFFNRIITETPCSFQNISKMLSNNKEKLALVPCGTMEKNYTNSVDRKKIILCVARYIRGRVSLITSQKIR